MAAIKIMVDYEANGLWCDEATWYRVPPALRERLYDWNWWWELGEYQKRRDGAYGLDYDPDVCAWIGLTLAMQAKLALPDAQVIFVHEAKWDRAIALALADGRHDVPRGQYIYEIFAGPDKIEARHV
ncbi:hypothetical protein DesfrDRAFT_2480 [Solidesulfovibrio fructosivorans JJ]]|uniref:Uncharacterized protein n=1 Tax=Solidesulfovibrio fructosivorans JJ] TaxID=596151 RepID=E1JXY1_SOLFR|nr:hypothetical protein [Solidesulfovibrio fructosivorans]EFL50719.1 hypothetical protein DesfrDRAFT_2480 [Solidesulfovibrio fructosivorans JJ]]